MTSYDLILGKVDVKPLSIIMSLQANSVNDISENPEVFLLSSKLPEIVLQSVIQENTPMLSGYNIYSDFLFTYVNSYDDVAIQLYLLSHHFLYKMSSDGESHEPTNMANASIINVKVSILTSFTFYGLVFSLAHFFGIRRLSMPPYIADTSRAVGAKEQCEYFAYKIGIDFTLPYVTLTLGTGVIAFAHVILVDFTPRRFLVILASGIFAGQEFATRSTIQPIRGYIIFTHSYTFHIQRFLSV